MTLLGIFFITSMHLVADPVCEDVYDQTTTCPPLDQTPLDHPGEPLSEEEQSDLSLLGAQPDGGLDFNTVGWGFMVGSGITASLAVSLQAASLFYRLRVWELAAANQLTIDTYRQMADAQYFLGIGATCLWFGSVLIAGSGASFWVFDPRNGSLRDPLASE
jgi:hypothetical protein